MPEVADFLRIATKTVYGLVRSGEIRFFRVGRAIRFRRVDVEAYMAKAADNENSTVHAGGR